MTFRPPIFTTTLVWLIIKGSNNGAWHKRIYNTQEETSRQIISFCSTQLFFGLFTKNQQQQEKIALSKYTRFLMPRKRKTQKNFEHENKGKITWLLTADQSFCYKFRGYLRRGKINRKWRRSILKLYHHTKENMAFLRDYVKKQTHFNVMGLPWTRAQ